MLSVSILPAPQVSVVSNIPDGTPLLRASFVALALLVAGLFVAGVYWSVLRAAAPPRRHTSLGARALWPPLP